MKQIIFNNEEELIENIKEYKIVLFIGNGSKNQYDKQKLYILDKKINYLIKYFDEKWNKKWIAIYGGDKYYSEHPDLGYVMNYLHKRNIKLCAIQNDIILNWNSQIDEYVNFVYFVKTEYNDNNQILWGGIYNNELVGPSKVYLEKFIKNEILDEIVVIGGGLIAKDEVIYAINKGFKPKYIKIKMGKKNNNKNKNIREYGFIEELLKNDIYKKNIIKF